MQIDSFSASGFRSLEDVRDIPVKNPTILVGPNDGGKSACLTALCFLLGKYQPVEDDFTLPRVDADGTPLPKSDAPEIAVTGIFRLSDAESREFSLPTIVEIRRTFSKADGAAWQIKRSVCKDVRLRGIEQDSLKVLKELAERYGVSSDGPATSKESWRSPLRKVAADLGFEDSWVELSKQLTNRLPVPFSYRGDDAPDPHIAVREALATRFKEYVDDDSITRALNAVGSNISKKLAADAREIRDHIAKRCNMHDVTIDPEIVIRPTLATPKLRMKDGHGKAVALGSSGAGRARRVSLAVWEAANSLIRKESEAEAANNDDPLDEVDRVIIYDEPDTHLDYHHQRRVMDLVREQCTLPRVRVVMATHSMNLIDGVDIGDIIHVESDGATECRVVVETPDDVVSRKLMTDLATALGFRNSVLLHERFFVGVEGVTEQQAFPLLFKTYTGRTLQSAGIALWPCGNNEGALQFASFLRQNNRAVAFVVDNDSTINRKDLFHEDRLRRFGLDPHHHCQYIGDPMELEDIFSDTQWCAAGNDLWPRNDGEPWSVEQVKALRQGKFSGKLWELFSADSDKAPRGKAEMMFGMAGWIRTAKDVPLQLQQVFDYLVKQAESLHGDPQDPGCGPEDR